MNERPHINQIQGTPPPYLSSAVTVRSITSLDVKIGSRFSVRPSVDELDIRLDGW